MFIPFFIPLLSFFLQGSWEETDINNTVSLFIQRPFKLKYLIPLGYFFVYLYSFVKSSDFYLALALLDLYAIFKSVVQFRHFLRLKLGLPRWH